MIADLNPKYIKTKPYKALTRLISYIFFTGRPLTTKGQWINPYLFSLFNFLTKCPQQKKVTKPIFIIGMGRSGTTILGNILSMHKQIGFLNEPKALWHYIYPKQDIIGSHSIGEAHYCLDEHHVDTFVKLKANRIYGAFLATTFSKRILDKYPEMIFRIPFIKAIFPDAKFILIIRNGWDVIHSVTKWSEKYGTIKNRYKHDWWGYNDRKWNLLVEQLVMNSSVLHENLEKIKSFKGHMDRAAVEWIVTMERITKITRNYSDDVYQLKFEDLTTNPRKILNKILKFCELKEDNKFLEYACNTFKQIRRKPQLKLHDSIQGHFNTMMQELRYL